MFAVPAASRQSSAVDSGRHGHAAGKRLPPDVIYVLERFPGGTLNFVYNEIRGLDATGMRVEVVSLLPAVDVPVEAKDFEARTSNLRPIAWKDAAAALIYYAFSQPGRLASLFLRFPWEDARRFPAKPLRALGHVLQGVVLAARLKNFRGHVHAHFAFKAATAAYVVARLNGNTFSFTAHGSATVEPARRFSLKAKVKAASFVVAVSEYNRSVLRSVCPNCPGDRIIVNRTGILLEEFPMRDEPAARATPRIVCVATLYPVKNHEGLLRAASVLAGRGRDFRLELVGRDDIGLGERLAELAAQLGIGERVVFRGPLDHGHIAALLAEASLVVLASHSEGIPVSLMEAMAVGVPVVGPRVTGVPELIEDGVSGLLADPGDPDGLADAMAKMLDGGTAVRSMVSAARRKVEQEFDMSRNAARFAAYLAQRLDDRGA